MRACVLGANGQLGRALTAARPDAVALGRDGLDIGDAAAVERHDFSGVDVVFNAAAHTAVDRAETEPAAAWRVNALGPAHLAAAADRYGFTLVHVSTEYVFDGTAAGPMGEDTPLAPLGVYGASKAAGELAVRAAPRHLVARTSWVVGDGGNFVATMTRLARDGVSPAVVDDQVGRPTFAPDLAAALVALAGRGTTGTVHVTGDGDPVSWCGLAREVFARCGRDPADVRAVSTAEYTVDKPHLARRPANSVLDLTLLASTGVVMPSWKDSLDVHMGASA
ncbi:dTDP-4-dehydrorhamnose reductase [Pseudonocardia nematodicida]|uniref:dTDP-4-dehydrorhamnose reductase n=1 Tax=Pseudonocardia nematodicida TaxID=1206997 RepID=A0ABV1K3U8_9PSEU